MDMNQIKVGCVVLNYINYSETERCLISLMQQEDIQLTVVVVDNGSQNGSLECIQRDLRLRNSKTEEGRVNFIQINKNIGFAGGMNCGIKFLREKGIQFIFIANSDLVFTATNILAKLVEGYEVGVAVLNPYIVNVDGKVARPIYFKKKQMGLRMIKSFVLCRYNKRKNVIRKKDCLRQKPAEIVMNMGRDRDCFRICGMGYLLTPDFWMHYQYLYPETFLYNEEYALMIYLLRGRLDSKSVSTEPVIHKHGASTFRSKERTNCFAPWNSKDGKSRGSILKLIPLSERQIRSRYSYPFLRMFWDNKITINEIAWKEK